MKHRLAERGGSGIADFIHDWSQGLADLEAARFFGGHTLPRTRVQWQAGGQDVLNRRNEPVCIEVQPPKPFQVVYDLRNSRLWLNGIAVPPLPWWAVPPQLRQAYDIADPQRAGVCCQRVAPVAGGR